MKDILAKITPNKAEREKMQHAATSFLQKLNLKLKDAHAILGGSGAKDTWLAGNHDVDVFVLFPYEKYAPKTAELSNVLEPRLKKSFQRIKINRLHGSRDYFQLNYEQLNFEVIPLLKINKASQAKNITDISPLHSIWVNKKTKKLKGEIRLAKQFLRAQRLYGAESYIMGLSGYVVEILIAQYGSLQKLLKASQVWKVKEVIDVEKYYPKKDVLFQLNKSKTQSPLIVIDPMDKGRNAAAALSLEKFLLLKKVAKDYLHQPTAAFFELQRVDLQQLQQEAEKNRLNLVYLSLLPLPGKEDVAGTKLLKAFNFLQEKLAPFTIKKSNWEWDKKATAQFYFFLEKRQLPVVEIRSGPPLKLITFVEHFKKKNKDHFVENERIMARIKTKHPLLSEYVDALVQETYVLERVKGIKEIKIV